MTCVAYADGFMAADREMGDAYVKTGRHIKVHIVREYLVGCAGESGLIQEWLAWFTAGADPQEFPQVLRDKDDHITALVVGRDGKISLYQRSPYAVPVDCKYHAIGSGREAAIAAMYLGHTATEAVEVAGVVCCGCGGGVDVLHLRDIDASAHSA